MVASSLTNNNYAEDSVDRTQGTLEYCRIHKIGMQAWSLLASWSPNGSVLNDFPELSAKLDEIGAKYGVGGAAVVTAWVLRHPAFVQVLTGTTSVEHLKEQCEYEKVTMTHGEWYDIYKAAGKQCTM